MIARRYDKYFGNVVNVQALTQNYDDVVPHIYPLILHSDFDRETVRNELLSKGVPTGFITCQIMN